MNPTARWTILAILMASYAVMVAAAMATGIAEDPAPVVWTVVVVPTMALAGVPIMWRRPDHPIGPLLVGAGSLALVVPTVLEILTLWVFLDSGPSSWMWAPMWLFNMSTAVGTVLFTALVVRLPDGRIRSRSERVFLRWVWLVPAFPALSLVSNSEVFTFAQSFVGLDEIASPVYIEALDPLGGVFSSLFLVSYFTIAGAIGFQFVRYRKSGRRERKQMRWVLFAGGFAVAWGLTWYGLEHLGLVDLGHGTLASLQAVVPVIVFPLSIPVAVLEPKWVDVDIVIRKSFVYGALSFTILALYVIVAGMLGVAAGRMVELEVAVFLTVVVAILFQPARRRLQRLADRWVFGDRPSKYQAVADLGATIEESSDPSELLPQLVETIRLVLRLNWVTVELDDGTTATSGMPADDPALRVPMVSGTQSLGEIRCGPKTDGSIDEEEIRLVHTLAGQVGLAVANERLAGRIVNAAEAERRRIERNIHDGAQQELVALVARLGMARAEAEQRVLEPETLAELQQEATRILSDLRELAQGIHPSVLSDGGVLEAVEERCSHLPITVAVDAETGMRQERFPDEIEGAAYFFVTETLANVLKHSHATEADVSLQRSDGQLLLSVADNGRGFDPRRVSENGIAGLRDRMTALGGSLTVESHPGNTRVSATLPVE